MENGISLESDCRLLASVLLSLQAQRKRYIGKGKADMFQNIKVSRGIRGKKKEGVNSGNFFMI